MPKYGKASENGQIPTRRSLLSRLKNWTDSECWSEFFETYWRLIYSAAIKANLTPTEAEEVVQETLMDVAKNMPDFKYDSAKGSFKGWLMTLTVWRIKDHVRRRHFGIQYVTPGPSDPDRTDTLERVPDPAGLELQRIWDEEWEKNLMEVAIERVKGQVEAKQFQIFDFYVFKKWPVARVARALKLSRSQVYLAKHRITRLIRKEVDLLRREPT